MNKKIFRSTWLVALFVFLLSFALMMGTLYRQLERQVRADLGSKAQYIAHAVEQQGAAYFNGFISGETRVTWIAQDGRVLYETDADVESLDNHLAREEVQAALQTGIGSSARYSQTLTERTFYYAERLSDGTVLRLATTRNSIVTFLIVLVRPLVVIILLAWILSAFLASKVSKSIIKPINELDLDHPAEEQTYEELTPLLSKIARQKREIEAQITEARKRQEEFRLITENMREGILVVDTATNLLTCNTAALHLLNVEKASGGSVLNLNRTSEFRNLVQAALEGARTVSGMTQSERQYELIANPVWENELVIGAVILILDVTEQSQRETLRREFSANVSHELKTPLTSISGFAELMKNGGMPEADVVDFSNSIYEEAQRMITLVSDIIRLAQLDEKSTLYEKEPVDLYALASETIEHLAWDAQSRGVTIELHGERAEMLGARQIISEMIHNLCENALKYNRKDGRVDVTVRQSELDVSLAVHDTGIGIAPADQERVFERFYRVDKSHSKQIGGTGLGLSIVKHGAMYHDAQLKLESVPDEGTTITVIFPK
ncbi:MAG: ATP-binding protein [Evtepia sp.]